MISGALTIDQYFEEPPQRRISLTGAITAQSQNAFPPRYASFPARRPSQPSPPQVSAQPHSLERVLPGLAFSGKQASNLLDIACPVPVSPPSRASIWDLSSDRTWPTDQTNERQGGVEKTAPSKPPQSPVRPPSVKAITPPREISPVQQAPKLTRSRQPPKSDYALWVGNLPPHPSLTEICKVFASPELLSVYLIQRTGCAFVNFRNKAGLDTAFEMSQGGQVIIRDHRLVVKAQQSDQSEASSSSSDLSNSPPSAAGSPNRYFVCKSLSMTDLETARKTSLWSTQLHNAERFNEAFRTAENVYFIFSANRTSSYFGYARMESEIPEDDVLPPVCSEPAEESTMEVRLTEAIIDLNTGEELCPPGEIVEDTRRGCLFWQSQDCPQEETEQERWTAPCKLKWLSNGTSLPFTQTKHLRNPLNDDKPVKIARDGTEIEPTVGEKLCSLFAT